MPFDNPAASQPPARRRNRRLPNETNIAAAVLAQALANGHYLRTPADEQCPSGVWLLVPLDRRLVGILDLAGEEHADLEPNDDLEPDHEGEPSLGTNETVAQIASWQRREHLHAADLEEESHEGGDDDEAEPMKPRGRPLRTVPAFVAGAEEMFTHPELGVFHPI